MLMVTKKEWETVRICELENRLYNALLYKLGQRVGSLTIATLVMRNFWEMTLQEFDGNAYVAIGEVFRIVA